MAKVEVCPRCHHYIWTDEDCVFCDHLEAEVQDDLRAQAEEDLARMEGRDEGD